MSFLVDDDLFLPSTRNVVRLVRPGTAGPSVRKRRIPVNVVETKSEGEGECVF